MQKDDGKVFAFDAGGTLNRKNSFIIVFDIIINIELNIDIDVILDANSENRK